MNKKKIIIVGGGFGGLRAARGLNRSGAGITLIDRRNHHLFQPLLYQVATAALSPADIAAPIRGVLRDQERVDVMLGEVIGVDARNKQVQVRDRSLAFDYLVLATGSYHSYFGRDEWEQYAPGLKSIEDATLIRERILWAFEKAEMEADPKMRDQYLTFIIVGGGPTGVEMAGSIAELARVALVRDFRHIKPTSARILLIEAGPRVLAAFPEKLSWSAHRDLNRLGVEIMTGGRVEQVDADGVIVQGKRIFSKVAIWAAGVRASNAGKWLGVPTDRAGRVIVSSDLSVPGHPDIFVIGDTAHFEQEPGEALPGLAPVAMQQGTYVAGVIRKRLAGNGARVKPFHYLDKGNLATIGRGTAIADIRKLKLTGFVAWLAWIFVHIFYLIGFRNRVIVMLEWAWSYFTYQRGARLITREEHDGLVPASEKKVVG